jgi:hypothetical protein
MSQIFHYLKDLATINQMKDRQVLGIYPLRPHAGLSHRILFYSPHLNLYECFLRVKKHIGIESDTGVVRFLIKNYCDKLTLGRED